jgi:predicted nucleotide-binding protein
VSIDAESGVVANDYAERLPPEIGLTLNEIQYLTAIRDKYERRMEGREPLPNSVFLVHGRDEYTKIIAARFLEKLGLNVVILHEQPDKGRTVIEKLIDHSAVMYAVVLLTADDIGGLMSEQHTLSPRARQNVIFEMGFFIGKLGRNRVCALHKGVELPSDLHGLLYISMDDPMGQWQLSLARELREAGFAIDLNKMLNA